MTNKERSPAAQALIEYAKNIESERDRMKALLLRIYRQPNCRHEVEAQLGEDAWADAGDLK